MALSSQAYSRDTTVMISIEEAFASADYQEKLDPNITFYFGEQPHPKIEKSLGNYTTNKKTNAFNKSDEGACKWAILSGLIALQERAAKEGGNAVVNVVSYYKRNTMKSETEIECHAGALMAGAALNGDVVKLSK
jgi:hypothetical protein